MTLLNAQEKTNYTISDILTNDEKMNDFLLTLGLYRGENIKIILKMKNNMIISIKDIRYSIDNKLAKAILIN